MVESSSDRAKRITKQMVQRIDQFTDADLSRCEELTKLIMGQIEGQVESDSPLTDQDEEMIQMAVASAYFHLVIEARKKDGGS